MMEDLGFEDMDPSILSKVINGKRIFSKKQLDSFCKILTISKTDAFLLRESIVRDFLSKKGFEIEASGCMVIMNQDMAPIAPKIIKSLREGGEIKNALLVADYYENFFENELQIRSSRIKELYGSVCVEKAKILSDISAKDSIIQATRPYNDKTAIIGQETNNFEIINLTYLNIITNFYITCEWQKVADYSESVLNTVDDNTQSELLRMLLFAYAHKEDKEKLSKTIKRSKQLINKFNAANDRAATIIEGISGSLAIIHEFDEAEKVLSELKSLNYIRPFYQSQVLRGQLRKDLLMKQTGKPVDLDSILSIEKNLKNPKLMVFERHQKQIKSLLAKIKQDVC